MPRCTNLVAEMTQRVTSIVLIVTAMSLVPTLVADDGSSSHLTGAELRQKLASPASVLWADNPLRPALLDFGKAQGAAVLLDRRVDPGQMLQLTVRQQPVVDVFRSVAQRQQLGVSIVGNVVYMAPVASADQIRTLVELRWQDVKRRGAGVARKFARQETLAWPDFRTPRELLSQLAEEQGLEFVNLERVPHDLWAATQLPRLTLIERLSLLLIQFDLTFQIADDGRRLAVIDLPDRVVIVRDYPAGDSPQQRLAAWKRLAPDCRFHLAAGRIHVQGRLEDHERIDAGRRPAPPATSEGPTGPSASPISPQQVFTADVPNKPLGAVLTHFAQQLGLQLQVDQRSLQDAGVSLEQLITFEVENASFDELFEAVLEPVGCEHELKGATLGVRAKP